jgi:Zn finger protein HypA/HybF involved in hydrogenase expression
LGIQKFLKVVLYVILMGLIVLFILGVVSPLLFDHLFKQAMSVLEKSFLLEGWHILILGMFSFLALCQSIYFLLVLNAKKLPWSHYKQDSFKDITWKWSWKKDKVEKLWCYCPSCHEPLTYRCDHLLYQTHFICEKCEKELSIYDGDSLHHVMTRVCRDIKRVLKKKHQIDL